MTAAFEHIRLEDDGGGVALLTFDRPEVSNAIHLAMNLEIRSALEALEARDDVRVLVLTGAGEKAFAGGADIAELSEREGPVALARHNAKLTDAIASFPRPTIAAVRGVALGGGLEVALACDLRVAGRSARLGQPEVGLGILPAAGATFRLPALVGIAKAKELCFTGRIVGADEALALGLVNHVVDDAAVLEKASEIAREIARQSPLAVRLAKVALDGGREASRGTATWLEALAQHVLYDDEEKDRRMSAYLESRAARRKARKEEAGG